MGKFAKSARALAAVFLAAVFACVYSVNISAAAKSEKKSISLIGKYDSSDTASVRSIDSENKTIRFRNHSTGKTYTLSYDNTSMMYDLRGTPMSARLLEEGQIVDVNFLKSSKHITSLKVSDEAWTIDNTRSHELVRGDGTAKIQGETYKLDSRTLILADGEPAIAENVLTTDNIKAYGIGKEVYSVVVTSGHGYVSLSSDTVDDHSLVGAWLELDNDVIYKISPNMLLSAPEGDYTLQIIGNGAEYKTNVSINRNEETVIDTRNVRVTKPKEGLVSFEVTPADAEIYIDGEQVFADTSKSVSYGYHNLKVMAEGYITQNKYLKVGTPKSVVKIELEPESDDADSSSSSSSDSSSFASSHEKTNKSSSAVSVATLPGKSSAATSASSITDKDKVKNQKNKVIEGYKIYVDEPVGAEMFFDGNYIGVVPTSLKKISGNHEITLRKNGYITKSLRVSIDTDESDVSYNLGEMTEVKKETETKHKEEESPVAASTERTVEKPADSASGSTTHDAVSKDGSSSSGKSDTSAATERTTATAHYASTASSEEDDSSSKKSTAEAAAKSSTKEDVTTTSDKENSVNKDNKNNKDDKDKKEDGDDKEEAEKNKDKSDAANTASGEE